MATNNQNSLPSCVLEALRGMGFRPDDSMRAQAQEWWEWYTAKAAWYDDRHDEDLVMYGPVGKCVEAYIPARRKEGREPVIVTPDTKPPEDMPYFDFMVRDALIDIRWGEKLAAVDSSGDVTVVRLGSGKTIRCATFRNLSENRKA